MKSEDPPWYADGLRFECTLCGHCCRGDGYVWLSESRIAEIAGFLGLEPEEFTRRYVRRVGNRLSLVDKPNKDCIFWEPDAGCAIYQVRPGQCRTFPFWPEHLESPAAWQEAAGECPGIGSGRRYDRDQIERLRRRS